MTDYPKVSVITITYGHENYITQTIDGVMMQDFPGKIEFIIANDNSPDQTHEVVKKYFETHPVPENFEIKYTKHDNNKGMIPNFIWAMEQATGKYIALCEGDDYWIDAFKLQKQVDMLQNNADAVLCFTDRSILEKDKVVESKILLTKKKFNKKEIPHTYVPTLTAVFRNHSAVIPKRLYGSFIDASLFLFLSQFGTFIYMDEITAVYRIHDGGVYSGNSELVNYKRSVSARRNAFRYLKNVDMISLAENIVFWLRLKKDAEIKKKYFFTAFCSHVIIKMYIFYLMKDYLVKKYLQQNNEKN